MHALTCQRLFQLFNDGVTLHITHFKREEHIKSAVDFFELVGYWLSLYVQHLLLLFKDNFQGLSDLHFVLKGLRKIEMRVSCIERCGEKLGEVEILVVGPEVHSAQTDQGHGVPIQQPHLGIAL